MGPKELLVVGPVGWALDLAGGFQDGHFLHEGGDFDGGRPVDLDGNVQQVLGDRDDLMGR